MAQQSKSLTDRLYGDPVYEEIIRLVGYEGIARSDFEKLRTSLCKKYRKQASQAIRLLTCSDQATRHPQRVCLNPKIRNRVWPFLGTDPKNQPWWEATSTASQQDTVVTKPKSPPRKKPAKKVTRTFSSCRRKSVK